MTLIVGLVQARMGSTRLPQKVMKPLAGFPLIRHIFDRLRVTSGIGSLVLATTEDPLNDSLVEYVRSLDIRICRYDEENDLAGRLASAARLTKADAILKVNADCPMVDPAIMSRVTSEFLTHPKVDYVSNKINWTWPEGMSVELITRRALEWCDTKLRKNLDRELVANWIRNHSDRFPQISITADADYYTDQPALSVDTEEDYMCVRDIFDALYSKNPLFGFDDIRAWRQIKSEGTGQ